MNVTAKRAIIVEDSPQFLDLVQLALNSMGIMEIVKVENGAEAIEALKSRGADIMIMDWMMDVMDGVECTRQIRAGTAGGGHVHIPIILLTAKTDDASKTAAAQAGVSHFIGKPFTLKQLLAGVTKLLNPDPESVQPARA